MSSLTSFAGVIIRDGNGSIVSIQPTQTLVSKTDWDLTAIYLLGSDGRGRKSFNTG
jgi:hypothetical protein